MGCCARIAKIGHKIAPRAIPDDWSLNRRRSTRSRSGRIAQFPRRLETCQIFPAFRCPKNCLPEPFETVSAEGKLREEEIADSRSIFEKG